jgi:alpha-tubulin suppressor-like RCC1 family protein
MNGSRVVIKTIRTVAVGACAVILPLALSGAGASASPAAYGTIKHWGAYFGGPIVPLPYDLQRSPVRLDLPGRITEIATSNSTQYALLANGSVYAWGLGNTGQLGDGSTESSFTRPVRVRFPAGVKIASIPIDVMPYNTGLALDTTGHVWGWGYNSFGQLCLGNRTEYNTPVRLPLSRVTLLSGAGGHSLFYSRGTVYACGNNTYGELGNGTRRSSDVPVKVIGLGSGQVTTLVSAFADSGAVMANGTYYDWGYNGQGQVGNGVMGRAAITPFRVPLPAAVSQLAQGGSLQGNGQTITLLANGALYAWGAGRDYQLGTGTTANQSSPVQIFAPGGVRYRLLATSGATSYGLSTSGNVYAWGANIVGQVGNGGIRNARYPVRVASKATSISATAADVMISVRPRPCGASGWIC